VSHVEHLWRCCIKDLKFLTNKCETIETCVVLGEGRRARKWWVVMKIGTNYLEEVFKD
jgi:hypothetical protein